MTNVLSANSVTPPKERFAAVTDRLEPSDPQRESEGDDVCDDRDFLFEPSLALDQEAEARQLEWEESFAYFLNNGESY
jgi:hypothetical protein